MKPNCHVKICKRKIVPDKNVPERVLFENVDAEMQSLGLQENKPTYKIFIFRSNLELPKIQDVVEVLDYPNFPELQKRWTLIANPVINTVTGLVEITVRELKQIKFV